MRTALKVFAIINIVLGSLGLIYGLVDEMVADTVGSL